MRKPKAIAINGLRIEFAHRQYLRFEICQGANYLGSLDPDVKFGRRDVKRLRDWCDTMLFNSSAAGHERKKR